MPQNGVAGEYDTTSLRHRTVFVSDVARLLDGSAALGQLSAVLSCRRLAIQ